MTDEQRRHRLAKMETMVGTPFRQLPGEPPHHKILAEIDGQKIRVEVVEMVMNDAWMMDWCDGAGSYIATYQPHEMNFKVYQLAVELYGCQPIDLHGGRVGKYTEVVN